MLWNEFIEGTNCRDNDYNYKVYKDLEIMYMNSDMTKAQIYEYGKKLVNNEDTEEQKAFKEELKQNIKYFKEFVESYKKDKEYYKHMLEISEGEDKKYYKDRMKNTAEQIKWYANRIKELHWILGGC